MNINGLQIILPVLLLLSFFVPWHGYHHVYARTDPGTKVVEVKYKEHGKLLALMSVTFNITARAKPDGTIELVYPWYSFITLDNRDRIETDLKVAVNHALRSRLVGSVQAARATPQEGFSAEEVRVVTAEVERVLKENFESAAIEG